MRRKKKDKQNLNHYPIVVYTIVGIAVFAVLTFVWIKVSQSRFFDIKKIEFSGYYNLEKEFLEGKTSHLLDENIFSVSQKEVSDIFDGFPIMKDLKVSKWFSNLSIEVIERKGKFYLKDSEGDLHVLSDDKMIISNSNFQSNEIYPVIASDVKPDLCQIGKLINDAFVDTVFFYDKKLSQIDKEFCKNVSEFYEKDGNFYVYDAFSNCRFILCEDNLRNQLILALGVVNNRTIAVGTILDLRFKEIIVIREAHK